MMKKAFFSAAAAVFLTATAAGAAGINNSPPAGAIIDLGGGETGTAAQTVNHNGDAPTTETVTFIAGSANTDITFALREDPAFLYLSNISLVNNTTSSGNLLINGNFAGGTYTSNGNNLAPIGWTFDNVYGAAASGVVSSDCGSVFAFCWVDGSVQAYDAIDQVVSTIVGNTYTLSFDYWDDGGLGTFSDLSTNGVIDGTGGNGIDILAYAQTGLPVACPPGQVCTTPPTTVPEPLTVSLFGAGLAGSAIIRRRRKAAKS